MFNAERKQSAIILCYENLLQKATPYVIHIAYAVPENPKKETQFLIKQGSEVLYRIEKPLSEVCIVIARIKRVPERLILSSAVCKEFGIGSRASSISLLFSASHKIMIAGTQAKYMRMTTLGIWKIGLNLDYEEVLQMMIDLHTNHGLRVVKEN
jgi:hypothetical protein